MGTRVGIIGYGGFGRFLHRAWAGIPDIDVVAVADPAANVGVSDLTVFDSAESLIASRTVDVVSVSTPPADHVRQAVEALRHGVHVLVEKPIATSVADAMILTAAQRASPALATVNFMLRYNPIVQCIHEWCASGAFGRLERVVVENYAQNDSLDPDHWFWKPTVSGGIMVEHGVHFIDLVNACTDADVCRVAQRGWSRADGHEDRVYALVEYDDGLVASHYHAFNRIEAFERTSIRFVFERAQLDVAGWIPMNGRFSVVASPTEEEHLAGLPNVSVDGSTPVRSGSVSAPPQSVLEGSFALNTSKEEAYLQALRGLMTDFLDAARQPGHQPIVNLDDGLAALQVALTT